MWFFSFFQKQSLNPKILTHIQSIGISEVEFVDFLSSFPISDPYRYANSSQGWNAFLSIMWTKEQFFNFFTLRFQLIQKYAPEKFEDILFSEKIILNWFVSYEELIKSCDFFSSEWIKNPLENIEKYGYNIFYRGWKIQKVIDKYEYIKSHPYLTWRIQDPLIFTLESTDSISITRIQEELEIYNECDAMDIFFSDINRFGIISKWKEKLAIFEELGYSCIQRNKYLRKNFISVMDYHISPVHLRDILSK